MEDKILQQFHERTQSFCVQKCTQLIPNYRKTYSNDNMYENLKTWFYNWPCKNALLSGNPFPDWVDMEQNVFKPTLQTLNENLWASHLPGMHFHFSYDSFSCTKKATKDDCNEVFPEFNHDFIHKLLPITFHSIDEQIKEGEAKKGDVFHSIRPHIYHYGGGSKNLLSNAKFSEYHVDNINWIGIGGIHKLIPIVHGRNGDYYNKPDSMYYILSLHSYIHILSNNP